MLFDAWSPERIDRRPRSGLAGRKQGSLPSLWAGPNPLFSRPWSKSILRTGLRLVLPGPGCTGAVVVEFDHASKFYEADLAVPVAVGWVARGGMEH